MFKLHVDVETRSEVDLKKAGVHVYAEHSSTEILCAGYAFDDEAVRTWRRGHDPSHFRAALEDADEVHCHNAAFERMVINGAAGRKLGLPSLFVKQMRCTMVAGLALGLPGSLEGMAPAVGLDIRKDQAGHRVMLKMCKPRKPRKHEAAGLYWHEDPADFDKLVAYCAQDVAVEREIEKRLLPLSPNELELWFLDQRINDRGVLVDVELAEGAKRIVAKVAKELDKRMKIVSRDEHGMPRVRGVTDLSGLMAWARAGGFPDLDSLAKDRLAALLTRDDLPPQLREALQIRQEGAKASVAKIDTLLRSRGSTGRARGLLQFHAANTGRWAGRRFQPQNLKRPETPDAAMSELCDILRTGEWGPAEELCFGPALSAVGDSIRGMVVSGAGYDLIAADYANIEGRVLAWEAGEAKTLDAFRAYDAGTGPDLYKITSAGITGKRIEDVTKAERQATGKVPDLAMGYQGGVGAFLAMAKTYGVQAADYYDLLRSTAPDHFKAATDAYAGRGRSSGVALQTWVAAETIKLGWRAKRPKTVAFWADIEKAAIGAVQTAGRVFTVGPLRFKKAGSWLFMRLPSGRAMAYPYPEAREVPYFGKTKLALTYKTVPDPLKPFKVLTESDGSINMRWARISTYGGMLAENATQAIARDILAKGMQNLEMGGYHVVLHVHDEAVAEVRSDFGSEAEFCRLMTDLGPFYDGLPVTAESFRARRYRK